MSLERKEDDLDMSLERKEDNLDMLEERKEDELEKFLEQNPDVDIIRFNWIDYSGVLRTRFVPVALCRAIVGEHEDYQVPQTSLTVPVSTAPESFPPGIGVEVLGLRPDCRSLRVCGFKPNHASVMCFVEQKFGPENQQYDLCPRSFLVDLLDRFAHEWDRKDGGILAGFEIEFMLLDQNFQPLNHLDRLNSYQTTAGLRGKTMDIIEEILRCFEKSSIKTYHFHTETRGQIEISLNRELLLDAIDSFVLAQETIRTVFIQHNIKVTMTPKPLLEGPTNGIHLHMSADHVNVEVAKSFLAGIMHNIRPLCAFGMASYDSYARTVPNAAGVWAGWGTENRDLPVRRIHEHHWEFRMLDATANPYLFAGVVLLAGFTGVRFGVELNLNDCRIFPHKVDQEQGNPKYGLVEKMPTSLREALNSLNADENMRIQDYKDIWLSYIRVKEKEIEVFEQMTPEQRRLKFLEYF